jgi:hypothetical protein
MHLDITRKQYRIVIRYCEFLTSKCDEIKSQIVGDLGQLPPDDGRLHSLYPPSYPDLVLMSGKRVASHDDRFKGWQPILILENLGWCIKGSSQKGSFYSPQPPGTLLVLDISMKHMVCLDRSRGGLRPGSWMGLCWNPDRCPPHQDQYTLEDVVKLATQRFLSVQAKTSVATEVSRLTCIKSLQYSN